MKATSLSGVLLLAGVYTALAQTEPAAPQLPSPPTTEMPPPSLQSLQEGGLSLEVANQPESLNVPSSETQLSSDTTSTLPPTVKSESATAPEAENLSTESETGEAITEATITAPEPEIATPQTTTEQIEAAAKRATTFLQHGGPSIWAIAALSVITVALILWKIWRLALIGAWARGKAQKAVSLYEDGNTDTAQALVSRRRGLRSKVVGAAITARETLTEDAAREETARVARRELGEAAVGLRALELIATIAPLLGLLGTVLGMISAFQALQESGSSADPSLLAGGIWEALLTTAAGMAVAIPASAALTWFEAVIDRMRRDVEDAAMRIFVTRKEMDAITVQALAAE
ncbi:MotA/TolQ/ExbB proton channel family protein [uncultured Shimia sp.]|uniref:MotA/TolQ/ExbB proton channel family protein n=1 Tax=uncultured Shimia sp. TaxID=573152 RepID=UPI00262E0887|nr:MotA/TolQ/ExbB proton channel family protein [uncultured Shimia sp.]